MHVDLKLVKQAMNKCLLTQIFVPLPVRIVQIDGWVKHLCYTAGGPKRPTPFREQDRTLFDNTIYYSNLSQTLHYCVIYGIVYC